MVEELASVADRAAVLAAAALAAEDTRGISDATVQQLLTAGLTLFARKTEAERRHFPPIATGDAVTPTEAAVLVTELLRAVNLNLFDLSMWASRPRHDEGETA
jgi:hypothetical protein